MNELVKEVVVVGGGTAGWLSANILAAKLNGKINITLIESPDIPTIGVGEGTVPTMRETLKLIGISETEFIKSCNATFKQAIKFVNWMKPADEELCHQYYHLFQYPLTQKSDPTPFWLKDTCATKYQDSVSLQGAACDHGLGPKKITNKEYEGIFDYAYHLDAGKFANLLAKHGVKHWGINHIRQTVSKVTLSDQGSIHSLVLGNKDVVNADLFIDCSGFKALLIEKALNVEFESKNDILFVDRAITVQVPYKDYTQPILSHTIASAHKFGWTWDIGLTERRGVGFVYSSKYCNEQLALETIKEYIGEEAESLKFNTIKMNIGYRKKFWHKNCVAIGLSAGFLEPLEATAILLIEATAKLVADNFPFQKQAIDSASEQVNRITRYGWDRVIEFIKLHYCISDRDDSQFWIDNRNESTIPQALLNKLNTWKYRPPMHSDFFSKYDVFHLENHQYVLYGMNYPTKITEQQLSNEGSKNYEKQKNYLIAQRKSLINNLPEHRELIDKIKTFGLQKI